MPRPVKQTTRDPQKIKVSAKSSKRNNGKKTDFFEDNPGNLDEDGLGQGGVIDLAFEVR